jgi:hypothetical protein
MERQYRVHHKTTLPKPEASMNRSRSFAPPNTSSMEPAALSNDFASLKLRWQIRCGRRLR